MIRPYERLGIVSLHEVLQAIAEKRPFEFEGVVCHTTGSRLLTYHIHGFRCCVPSCSIHGQYFAIEKAVNQSNAKYHLNLYCSLNGQEVMMTSDHRLPKSLGGSNHVSNRQPMCAPHNAKKGNKLIYT